MRLLLAALIAIIIFSFNSNSKKTIDTIVYNAVVYTVNNNFDKAEALIMEKLLKLVKAQQYEVNILQKK